MSAAASLDADSFTIEGVTGAVPAGFEDPAVGELSVFLGRNEGDGHIDSLAVVLPDPPPTPGQTPSPTPVTPADMRRVLDACDVVVQEWGHVSVDGVKAPVLTLDGFELCGAPESCSSNVEAQERFYVLVPWAHGTVVVEGGIKEDVMTPDRPSAEEMTTAIGELQAWADSIDLP